MVVDEAALAARAEAHREPQGGQSRSLRADAASSSSASGGAGSSTGPSTASAASPDAPRISPVVPRSARKVAEDDEGMGLFVVNVLSNYLEEFSSAAKARRYIVRDWKYTPTAGGELSTQSARAEVEMRAALAELRGQTERMYSECFKVWVHMSAIKLFVESILEYGLPVRCSFAMVKPLPGKSELVRTRLQEAYAKESKSAAGGGFEGDLDSDEEEEAKGAGVRELPFVGWSVAVNESCRG